MEQKAEIMRDMSRKSREAEFREKRRQEELMLHTSKLDQEERKKIELWAEATYQLANSGMGPVNNTLATRIIQENSTIPIILTNEVGEIIGSRNIHESINLDSKHLQNHLERMKNEHDPIQIEVKMNGAEATDL